VKLLAPSKTRKVSFFFFLLLLFLLLLLFFFFFFFYPKIIKMFNLVCKPIITISYSQPIIQVLIQMDSFGTLTSYFFKNKFNIILPSFQALFSHGNFLTKLCWKILFLNLHAPCNTHFILSDLTSLVSHTKRYKLQ